LHGMNGLCFHLGDSIFRKIVCRLCNALPLL
jgi:hypothetical protein